ncbi:MAG: YtxH domain-containing protein [Gemmatimonadota bacterium]
MRDHDDLPYIVIERRGAGFGPFLWGALVGAGAALLLAPRSGAETQEDIRDRVIRVRSKAEERVGAVRDTANRTRTRIEDQFGAVREQFDEVLGRSDDRPGFGGDAAAEARRAAREARAEMERGRHAGSPGSEPLAGRPARPDAPARPEGPADLE